LEGAPSATVQIANPDGGVAATVYDKNEIDATIGGVTNEIGRLDGHLIQVTQLADKTAQDQARLKTDLEAYLTKQIGAILTPQMLAKIQEAAAAEATNRVLTRLRAQGVIQ
jgi:hypothetical protein